LAAYLRGEPPGAGPDGAEKQAVEEAWRRHKLRTEKVITNALRGTVPVDATGKLQWESAHPYLQTYLMQHAADAGTEAASALAQDKRFLAVTDQVTFSPYLGLAAFGPGDAPLFFGREAETAHLLALISDRLDKPGPLIVSGASGVGKSSLLGAGLLPALATGRLPARGSAAWPANLMRPGPRPLLELAATIAPLAGVPARDLEADLRADPARITGAIRKALLENTERDGNTTDRLVMIVDQFEEVFTQCADEQERRTFIKALSAAAGTTANGPAQAPMAIVVLGVRADFEARCAEYPDLANAVQDRYLVPPMTPSELQQAIVAPALAAGFHIDAGLVEILLHDAAGPSGAATAMPLLSYALDQTWRGRSGQNLTIADYERTGGIRGALAASAESTYHRLTTYQQAMAHGLFMRLIAVSEDGTWTAHPVSRTELTGSMPAGQERDLLAAIDAFVGERLLTLTYDTIAISHEVLLAAWPRLRAWLDDSRADQIVRTRLSRDAAEWMRSGQDPSYLYIGSRLASAHDAAARIVNTNQLPLSPSEREFLNASTRIGHRSARSQRMVVVLLIVVLLVLVIENVILLTR
jgi:hypothetical protein